MKYELDLSNVKGFEFLNGFKLPCEKGDYRLLYDLIESDIPKDIYIEIVKYCCSRQPDGDNENFPIGFDVIPVGGVLTRVE